jgi:hypothetical protein
MLNETRAKAYRQKKAKGHYSLWLCVFISWRAGKKLGCCWRGSYITYCACVRVKLVYSVCLSAEEHAADVGVLLRLCKSEACFLCVLISWRTGEKVGCSWRGSDTANVWEWSSFPLCVYHLKELGKCGMLLTWECYCECARVELVYSVC